MILLEGACEVRLEALDGAGHEHEDRRGHTVAGSRKMEEKWIIIRNRGGGCLRQTCGCPVGAGRERVQGGQDCEEMIMECCMI
jgi:hypothetical protein